MGSIDPKWLVWTLQRGYLRHGWAFIAMWVSGLALVLLAAVTAIGAWQLRSVEKELAARLDAMDNLKPSIVPGHKVEALPLPGLEHRFDMNREVFAGLEAAGLQPEQIRFRFEDLGNAGLVRQTAVFKHKATWGETADMLERLRMAKVPLYIARIRLERESQNDPLITAEIHVAAALNGASHVGEAAR